MMKYLLSIIFIGLTINLFAPPIDNEVKEQMKVQYEIYLKELQVKIHKEKVWLSIALWENRGKLDTNAYNKQEDAAGIVQIRKIYVDEVNRWSKKKYKYEDRFDSQKSFEMFCIINDKFNPEWDLDKAAHIHNAGAYSVNKRWHLTDNYRKEVNKIYNSI